MSNNSNFDFSRSEYTKYIIDNVEKEAIRNALFKLLDFGINNAFEIKRGKGQWNLQYIIKTWDSKAMLYCWDMQVVDLYLGHFRMVHPGIRSSFVQSLTKLSDGFNDIKKLDEGKKEELFYIEKTVTDPFIMDAFQKAVRKFQSEVYESPPLGKFSGQIK